MAGIPVHGVPAASDGELPAIIYGYGESSLGQFLAAIDDGGLCAMLFGQEQGILFDELRQAFPNRGLVPNGRFDSTNSIGATARLIEQPALLASLPMSAGGGDFEHMVRAALRLTRPGTTITPEEIAAMIGAHADAAAKVRACAAEDRLAVAAAFHRLQEMDGSSPAYRWGEERRRALLKRETEIPAI